MLIGQKVKIKIHDKANNESSRIKDRYFNGRIVAETPYFFTVQGKKYRESFMKCYLNTGRVVVM